MEEKSCAKELLPSIKSLKNLIILCTLLVILVQILSTFICYKHLKKHTFSRYYKTIDALEKIQNADIKYSKINLK